MGVRKLLAVILAASVGLGWAAAPDEEPDIAEAIGQVSEGDYDEAVLALDQATRRFRGSREDLATAHVYLAAAFLGLDQEKHALAALTQALLLDPDVDPPDAGVPEGFAELFRRARVAGLAASEKECVECPSRLPAILLGAAAGVGGAVGISVARGDDEEPAPTPTPDARRTERISGVSELYGGCATWLKEAGEFSVASPGVADVLVRWTPPADDYVMQLHLRKDERDIFAGPAAESSGSDTGELGFAFHVIPGDWSLYLVAGSGCWDHDLPPTTVEWEGTVTHP